MKCKLTWILCYFLIINVCPAVAQYDIIPVPAQLKQTNVSFTLDGNTNIYYGSGLKPQADLLHAALSPATGMDFKISEQRPASGRFISLRIAKLNSPGKEAYSLSVKNNQIVITGNTSAGVFYGIQTLLQLLPPQIYSKQLQKKTSWTVPGVEISDEPLYPWRGMMLDVARYFFEKDFVLKFLDMMAMYKMNTLHFHLVDDAGWRLEIKKYPKLTSIGAWRGEGANRTGGYYTQNDIKEIVAYAANRNIDVIPEIELPAHTLSAIAAYPFLCCTEEQYTVQTQHSISKELYCVGKESTFSFLQDVFDETFALFPSKYLHIGGDEANYERWKACPHCQKRKNELGLTAEKQLQVYFNQRVQKMAKASRKTIVGWDEIIEDGLTEKAVGMIWHDPKKAFKASEMGHYSVMSLTGYCYFDVAESNIPGEIKAATWLPPISLEKVYQLNPMMKGLDEKYRPQILGASGTLWADQFIHGTILQELPQINENRSEKYFEYLAFPRMAALAEVCWSPLENQSWTGFEQRMERHYNRYNLAGYSYRVPQPKLLNDEKPADGSTLKLKSVVNNAEIRYSTDGTPAHVHSTLYTAPVKIGKLGDFSAITVVNRNQYSLPLNFPAKYDRFKQNGQLIAEWKPSLIKGRDFSVFEFSASGKIDANGVYQLSFWYTGGESRLDIESVSVYKNGVKVAEDQHEGYTGHAQSANAFKLKIDSYETGAVFTIHARIRGDISNDSNGAIFIRKL